MFVVNEHVKKITIILCQLRSVQPAETLCQIGNNAGQLAVGVIKFGPCSTLESDRYDRILSHVLPAELTVLCYLKTAEKLLLPRGVAGILIVHLKETAECAHGQGLPEAPRAEQQEAAVCVYKEGLQVLCLVNIVDSVFPENRKILVSCFWFEPCLILTRLCHAAPPASV